MLKDLILGTAGHIDHGKTSLIRQLTGTNTDRLPEEKKRGITIELGYAHLDLPPFRLGIVDVPGHEKFVRQMLAGATGMDLALLVVAADDSVKQQTREHLDILRMLDLPAGVIALTKCDLVEPEWLDLVEEEIRGLVQETFLVSAPIIRTSAKTGQGMEELKAALSEASQQAADSSRQRQLNAPFKMAIDRTFTMEGHGTVVTGSVSSGSAAVGDALEIQPGGQAVRVRSLQNHESSATEVHRGQRAALNLAGVHHLEVGRGDEVCHPGHLQPSRLVTTELFLLSNVKKRLKDRTRVRFHVGTAELLANVRLLQSTELVPGDHGFAQFYLNEPAVAIWNQPFVVRSESPVFTIGGGRVLDPDAAPIRKPSSTDLQMLRQLTSSEEKERAAANAYFRFNQGWDPSGLPRTTGVFDIDETVQTMLDEGAIRRVKLSATRQLLIHHARFTEFCGRILKTLERMHREHPLRFKHPRTALEHQFDYLDSMELLTAAIEQLKQDKKIDVNRESIGLVGYGPKLSKGERQLLEQLNRQLQEAGVKPPSVKELEKLATKNRQSVQELLQMSADNGELVKITKEIYFHQQVMDEVRKTLTRALQETDGLTVSDIRQLLDTTRKYAVPLCEYLDSVGFTARDGDKRVLAPTAAP
ncbi:MAG: selenocysteine-specific translation elongation factor [Mariniblastus sp.]|nr:selenocysteine-specific translation elongation factor [Mariniblastus sp.]